MKKIILTFVLSFWLITGISNAQNITNTLGASGVFTLKDNSTTYLSLSQSSGNLSLNRGLVLSNTTSSTVGVVYKGADRFMHNFGIENTFLGVNSGNFTLSGNENVAIGYYCLSSNTSGSENVGLGSYALFSNSIGDLNSAIGSNSLPYNTTGNENTACGYSSLYYNSTGYQNTSVGSYSMFYNEVGYYNTAVGRSSMHFNTSGSHNTALGYESLSSNETGFHNTAVGYQSLLFNNGNYNTALGFNAGSTITTGANLTCIGIDAAPTTPTAIDQITLGNGFVSSLRCNVTTITSLSDARDKKNITELALGLDFITKLKPRQFNWDKREWYDGNISDGSKMKEEPTAGFIAQELDEAQTTENVEWLNLVLKDNPEKWEATPGNLLPIVVKAVQELKQEKDTEIAELRIKNEKLKIEKDEEIAELKDKNSNLEERLAKYEEMQTILVKELEQIKSNQQTFKVQIVNSENNNQ